MPKLDSIYDKYLPSADDEGQHSEDQTARYASDLVGGDQCLEDILGGLADYLVAVKRNESDFVAVEDPYETEGQCHEDVPTRQW